MASKTPRWVENTLAFLVPIGGSFFIAERNDRERYNLAKQIMINDIKAEWIRIGKKGNPFATTDLAVNDFMENALTGRAMYWADRLRVAKNSGEKRVTQRNLAVVDELTRNFMPVLPVEKRELKYDGGTGGTSDIPGYTSGSTGGQTMMVRPDGTITTAPQSPGTDQGKPWYSNMKIMIPVYLGAAALFYFMYKKR
jgi:hypothetical protein